MNYQHYLLPLAALLAMSGCDQIQSSRDAVSAADNNAATPTAVITEGVVLATVNGSPITQGVLDVYSAQRKSQGAGQDANDTATILDELIALELMRQEANNKGVNKEASSQGANNKEGSSLVGVSRPVISKVVPVVVMQTTIVLAVV